MAARLWLLAFEVAKAGGGVFADLASRVTDNFTVFETACGGHWRFELLLESEPDRVALETRAALAAAALGLPPPVLESAELAERDWLAENRRQFPPMRAGRFFVHGSFFAGAVPRGSIALDLDAGLAFGSGSHGSTRGCLLAIDRLARRRRFRRPLDLGCGSGILALAMAKLWRRPVAAADADPVAVAVARGNARRNGVQRLVRPLVSRGLAQRALRGGRRYDLIVANILARPLERLAPALVRALRPGGVLVLSGLLAGERAAVLAAYRTQGGTLAWRMTLGDWVTLVLQKAGPRGVR